jgi:hypothetical protein
MKEICIAAGLLESEIELTKYHVENPDHDSQPFYESLAFDKLTEYLCNEGEMPYRIAKAIDEEPDLWILNYLTSCNSNSAVVE